MADETTEYFQVHSVLVETKIVETHHLCISYLKLWNAYFYYILRRTCLDKVTTKFISLSDILLWCIKIFSKWETDFKNNDHHTINTIKKKEGEMSHMCYNKS